MADELRIHLSPIVLGAGKTKTVRIRLSAAARKDLKPGATYAVSARYSLSNATGATLSTTKAVKLKVPEV